MKDNLVKIGNMIVILNRIILKNEGGIVRVIIGYFRSGSRFEYDRDQKMILFLADLLEKYNNTLLGIHGSIAKDTLERFLWTLPTIGEIIRLWPCGSHK